MKKNNLIIAIVVVIVAFTGFYLASGQDNAEQTQTTTGSEKSPDTTEPPQNPTEEKNIKPAQESEKNMSEQTQTTTTGLKKEILQAGTGQEATAGQTVSVHYTGRLLNGTKFDSSLDRNQPFSFLLGAGQVIEGWEKGVAGMKVGEKAKLTIPYQMAYGEEGFPPVIPPKSDLVFEIELLSVK